MQEWQEEEKSYPTQGQRRGRKRNGPNKKVPAKDSNNVGYYFRRQYRQIYAKAHLKIQEFKKEDGKIEITNERREELISDLLTDPFLKDKDKIAQKIVDNVIFMLMRNGDLIITDIEKAECFATHKQIIDEALEAKEFGAARAANRDLMEIYEFFPKERKESSNQLIVEMEKKLKDGSSNKVIAMATGPEFIAMLWEGKKLAQEKKDIIQVVEVREDESNVRSIQEQETNSKEEDKEE